MPEHQDVKQFYDASYYAGEHEAHQVPWHMRRIASRLGLSAGDHALDVACGTGAWLQELERHGASISGIDISERAVASARQRLPMANIRQGVAEKLPFQDGQFDLVTCMGALEHFLDQPGALQEMRRVAKKRAHFLLLVPNAGFLTRRLGLYGGTQQASIRETVRSIDEWSEMFNAAGLDIKAKWKDLHPLDRHWITGGGLLRGSGQYEWLKPPCSPSGLSTGSIRFTSGVRRDDFMEGFPCSIQATLQRFKPNAV